MNCNIERWHKSLGKEKRLSILNGEYVKHRGESAISGWYADYTEGRFAFWIEPDRQYISWRKKRIELKPSSKVHWHSRIAGRKFELFSNGILQLKFNYRTLACRPWAVVTDFIIPDDDWGLDCDLPSFIHSHHSSGELSSMFVQWNEQKKS